MERYLERRRVEQSNFNDYRVLRMNEAAAQVEVHIVPSSEKPTGVGEPGVAPIGPAVAMRFLRPRQTRVRISFSRAHCQELTRHEFNAPKKRGRFYGPSGLVVIAAVVASYIVFVPIHRLCGGQRVALSAYPGRPTGVPAEMKSRASSKRGEYLTRAPTACLSHRQGRRPLPAAAHSFCVRNHLLHQHHARCRTGIGSYTDSNSRRRSQGCGAQQYELYPAMPMQLYYMSDADALAIKRIFHLEALRAPALPTRCLFLSISAAHEPMVGVLQSRQAL